LFELLDHCVDYDLVEKRPDDKAVQPAKRRRKRPRPAEDDGPESDG
jgi:hypothetical protein